MGRVVYDWRRAFVFVCNETLFVDMIVCYSSSSFLLNWLLCNDWFRSDVDGCHKTVCMDVSNNNKEREKERESMIV